VQGGDAQANARLTLDVLEGKPGAKRNMVLINAAAALVAAGAATDLREGVELAAKSIDHGAALTRLEQLAALGQGRTAQAVGA
jgi:anthranilate phosphoribosyltransferase